MDLKIKLRRRSKSEVNAYFDGMAAGIRLYACWKDGTEYNAEDVHPAMNDLQTIENIRQEALRLCDEN